ncbi:MAG: hypothetical protein JSU68_00075 [Phycisphaerales bacterium]|nr:MAG: hypothetical protein JSU68_00075 [Phycisphaerales bacterium]
MVSPSAGMYTLTGGSGEAVRPDCGRAVRVCPAFEFCCWLPLSVGAGGSTLMVLVLGSLVPAKSASNTAEKPV